MTSDAGIRQANVVTDLWDLIDHVPAGVVVHGADSAVIVANRAAAELLGDDLGRIRGRLVHDPAWRFINPDGTRMPTAEYPVARVLATRAPIKNLVLGIRKAGEADTWVMCNGYPILAPDGRVLEVVVTFTDITALERAQHALQKSEERFRLVIQGSNDASWDLDLETGAHYFSARWWEMLGRPADDDQQRMRDWQILLHADDVDPTRHALDAAMAGTASSFAIEFRLLHQKGHYVPILSRGFIVRDASGRPVRVAGTNTDLTERKRAEHRIHQLAFYDPLTELPNRRLLGVQLRRAIAAAARTRRFGALLFIDLDHFKVLNDTQGHETGDRLLQQVARRLTRVIREDETVSRLGGDEFVVLLTDLGDDLNEAAMTAELTGGRILETLSATYDLGESVRYHGTPSIGVALFNDASDSIESLLKHADLAMYQAKAMGRNTLRFFNADMQSAVDERMALQLDLRDALQRDEMVLHYQPQLAPGGRIVGAEALIRWRHPTRGTILPGSFIPLAEATGLILPLGAWVLQTACTQLVRWSRDPLFRELTLSINVSAHELREDRFVDSIRSVIDATGADPALLKLELTESVLADNVDETIGKMNALKAHGVLFSLDDFGTGYSSLSCLKRLPLAQLKIDRSFVREALGSDKDKAIAEIIVRLGATLDLDVVAEGIETDSQYRLLRDCGCRIFQGFLLGRPESIEDFEEALRRRAASGPVS